MKQRRTVLIAFLLLVVMVIGVGYAAVNADLLINGNATTSVTNISVYFTNTQITKSNNSITATAAGDGTATIQYDISNLQTTDDVVTTTFTVVNDSEFDVVLSVPTINFTIGQSYFNVEITDWTDGQTRTLGTEDGVDNSTTFTVKISLKDVYAETLSCGFNVALSATGVKASTNP